MTFTKHQVWMPYTQMLTAPNPQMVDRAEGPWLYTQEGKRILDAISSWWVNLHGHARPEIAEAIYHQALKLEQVISAGYSHEPAQRLAAELLKRLPGHLKHLFYSDNGSTAVEVGLKIAYQYWKNQGNQTRRGFLRLSNAYHGDTLGCMAVGERDLFNDVFSELLFESDEITPPYWHLGNEDVAAREEEALASLKAKLETEGERYAALILEPLIQGAAGMLMYRPPFLKALTELMQSYGILVIYDEVMTGFGRTGEWFAALKAQAKPDIICLSKGITGGTMPLAATVVTDEIYQAFLSEDPEKTFYHGHSYTANPLGCAAGLASLELMESESEANFKRLESWHFEEMEALMGHPRLEKQRIMGTIAAMDYKEVGSAKYNSRSEVIQAFLDRGVMLRPLGPSIYILTPYCLKREEMSLIYRSIREVLDA